MVKQKKTDKPAGKPKQKKEDRPVWRNSRAQQLLLEGILAGRVMAEDDPWDVYMSRPEFSPFETYFPSYLNRLFDKVKLEQPWADQAREALANDQRLHPPSDEPYPVFKGSEAEKLLRKDMDEGLHEELHPHALYNHREEYKRWPLDVFRNHIHQELRARIEGNYWKNYKEEKRHW
jgi:hypothetical protein